LTTITQNIANIAGADDNTPWVFYSKEIRESFAGGVVSTKQARKYPVDGVLTVELDPGPAVVIAVDGKHYPFIVPEEDTELWPLIQAAVAIPPTTTQEKLDAAVEKWLSGPAGGIPVSGITDMASGRAAVLTGDQAAARAAISATSPTEVTATVDARVALSAKYAPNIADGIFAAIDQALEDGRTAAIQTGSDSTGNAPGEWVYMLTQWIAIRHPTAHVKYRVANQAIHEAGGYAADFPAGWEVIQAGTNGERHAYFGTYSTTPNRRTFYLPADSFTAITGDIDVRVRCALANWNPGATQTLVSRYGSANGQRSFQLSVDSVGRLRFQWSADGTANPSVTVNTVAALGFAADAERWVRATLDVDNGAGGYTCTLYTSTDGATWTQVQQVVTNAGTTSIFNSGYAYEMGGSALTGALVRGGKFYEVQIRDGINGKIANPQPLEAWRPRDVSAPTYVAGDFRGSPTLYVTNGAVGGADTAFLRDNHFDILTHPYQSVPTLVFVSCSHNDGDLNGKPFLDGRDSWQTKIDARLPGSQTVWLTQNPRFIPAVDAPVSCTPVNNDGHAKRRVQLMAWAARKGVVCIDTYRAFLEDGRPIDNQLVGDGIHPTTGPDVSGAPSGSGVWRNAIINAWLQASP
jgi:hypothetical protein